MDEGRNTIDGWEEKSFQEGVEVREAEQLPDFTKG